MRKIILLLPLFLIASCSRPSVYIPESYRVKKKQSAETGQTTKKESAIIISGEKETQNIINAPFPEAWTAAVESVQFLKWPVAFMDEHDGLIRFKEAYVYRKSGKLVRAYTWPAKKDIQRSNINDYLEKIARWTPGSSSTVFTQENLKLSLKRVSDDVTEIKIDYSIRPYAYDGRIGYEVMSDGYIESLILERMRHDLAGKPVARN